MRSLPLSQFLIGVFSLFTLIISVSEYGGVGEYGAGFMPTILSALLLIFILLDAVIHIKQRKEKIVFSLTELKALALVIASITAFIVFVSYLGFFICATLLLFSLMALRNSQKMKWNVTYSILAAALINFVFGQILMVALPQGIWF